jgi:hypothetical protein
MLLRRISSDDLQNLNWDQVGHGWWRIMADLTCAKCGAYQAADSDPTNDKAEALGLCARLYESVGWKVDDNGQVICSDCQSLKKGR